MFVAFWEKKSEGIKTIYFIMTDYSRGLTKLRIEFLEGEVYSGQRGWEYYHHVDYFRNIYLHKTYVLMWTISSQ